MRGGRGASDGTELARAAVSVSATRQAEETRSATKEDKVSRVTYLA